MNKIFNTIGTGTVLTALISATVPTPTAAATISGTNIVTFNGEAAGLLEDRPTALSKDKKKKKHKECITVIFIPIYCIVITDIETNLASDVSPETPLGEKAITTVPELFELGDPLFMRRLLEDADVPFMSLEEVDVLSLAFEDSSPDSPLTFEDLSLALGDLSLAFGEKNGGDRTTIPEPSGVIALSILGLGAVASRLRRRS